MNQTKILPTRIFVDCHVFDGGFQGTRTYIKGIYLEMIKNKGYHFFFGANDIAALEQEFGTHANVSYIKYPPGGKIKRLLFVLPRLLKRHRIDFAHFQYRIPPVKACKYVVTTHDVLFEDFPEFFPKMNRLQSLLTYKFSAKKADLVLTVSNYSKNEIAKYLGVSNAVVTPNGIDSVFFDAYDKAAVKTEVSKKYGLNDYFIYISRLEPRKNQHLLLEQYVSLKLYEKHQIVIVGHETFHNPKLAKLLNSLDSEVKTNIKFIQHLPFEEMLLLLRASRAFIYPSLAEGFGIPPLEAAAARVPVLCSSETAMADFTFFGENLFNPRNTEEFASKLMRLSESLPDAFELQKISNEVAALYNWKNAAEIFQNALSEISY